MKPYFLRSLILVLGLLLATGTNAGNAMIQFSLSDQSRWAYFSDQVMGGVSEGKITFVTADGQPVMRLMGKVSTANRGGFIQARTKLDTAPPASAKGVVLNIRGNDQLYFVHLRTSGTLLPWQYYQASFNASRSWQEVKIPFDAFLASGRLLRKTPNVKSVRSLAIVAFGRDYEADLTVRFVGIY